MTAGNGPYRQTEWVPYAGMRKGIALRGDIDVVITSVLEAGTTLTPEEYQLNGSVLHRIAGDSPWSWSPGKIVVTFQAGFELLRTLPHNLELACLAVCKAEWHARGRDPAVRSRAAEGVGSVSFFDPQPGAAGMPAGVVPMLEAYVYRTGPA